MSDDTQARAARAHQDLAKALGRPASASETPTEPPAAQPVPEAPSGPNRPPSTRPTLWDRPEPELAAGDSHPSPPAACPEPAPEPIPCRQEYMEKLRAKAEARAKAQAERIASRPPRPTIKEQLVETGEEPPPPPPPPKPPGYIQARGMSLADLGMGIAVLSPEDAEEQRQWDAAMRQEGDRLTKQAVENLRRQGFAPRGTHG